MSSLLPDSPSLRIPEAVRTELCQQCGKCCQSVGFWLGPVAGPESWDHIRWIRFHGLKVDFSSVDGTLYYGVGFPSPCQELKVEEGRFRCGVYEDRPALCQRYDCLEPSPTLFHIQDSAWAVWLRMHPGEAAPETTAG